MKSFQSLEKKVGGFSNHWKIQRIVCAAAWMGASLFSSFARAEEIPSVSNPTVRICYLIPTNRTPQANGVVNLQRAFLVYREWFREQMALNGLGPVTFNLETEADGWTPKVYVVTTTNTDSYLAGDMWNRCWSSASDAGVPVWTYNQVWFLVGEAHSMQPDGSLVGHYAAATGDREKGLAVLSGDCLAMMEPTYLTNNADYNGLTIPEVGAYPLVYGTTYGTGEGATLSSLGSTYWGASLHEFGHCFHLDHDFRNDWNFHGNVMGNGFRGMRGYAYPALYTNDFARRSWAFARQLDLLRFFHPDRAEPDYTAPTIHSAPTGVVPVVNGKAQLDFSVSDASGLGLALLMDKNADYIGGGVMMEQALSGTSNNLTFLLPLYNISGTMTNQLRVQDIYGNERQTNFVFSVSGVTNRAPWSKIKIIPPMPAPGETVVFDATASSDPESALSEVSVEWDFNNDDVYDTPPMPCTTTWTTNFSAPARRLVKVRLTDPHGGVWVSSPVGMRVGLATRYVWTNSPQPLAPYDTWISAAHTISEAIEACVDGDSVVVAPGVYDAGGVTTPGGALTNRVCLTKAITVRADAGPEETVIAGASDGGGFGAAAVRCAFVGTNAVLDGFTLSGGWTLASGDTQRDQSGGGALVIGGCITNCRITGCSAYQYGGGAAMYYGGTILSSTLESNRASRGGGADMEHPGVTNLIQWCTVRGNTASNYGGGVYCRGVGLVANSTIFSNTAGRYGGGVHLTYTSRVENCAVYGNAATDSVTYGLGGGVMSEFNGPEVYNCTVADNNAGQMGGGIYFKDGTGTVVNSILYFNTAPSDANWGLSGAAGSRVIYSCVTPTNGLPSGLACVEGDPLFEDEAGRDFQLTRYSPALDAGLNSAWASNALDVVGNPRITGAAIDMGAYENPSLFVPEVTTDPVTNITDTAAESGGAVTHAGSYPVTVRGICWGASTNPTIADSHTTNGAGLGHFDGVLTNLSPGMAYHVRAYAGNASGVGYGEDRVFSTVALFSDISAGVSGVYFSAVAWGDVDNDGDLDILLSGYNGSSSLTGLWRNDGIAGFTNVTCGLPHCYYSALALGDYDGDGDLDVLISGTSTYLTRLYNNDGSGAFTDSGVSFPILYEGSAAWGDYDNDGDLDLLLTGQTSDATDGYRLTRLYRNDNGAFTAIAVGLPAVYESSATWGDYDLDGDLDVLISGDSTAGRITRVYANLGADIFTNINAGLVGIDEGQAAWGDYDNDGYLDILLSGNATTRIYRNDGIGGFTDIGAGLQALSCASVAWGDYDADGDPDALVCGYSGTCLTYLYRNDGGTFTRVADANLSGVYNGAAAWGDYDNDGRLDLLLAGSGADGASTYVYRNRNGVSNAPPAAPSGLMAVTNGLAVTLSWAALADDSTPSNGLTCNIRIGTEPGGGNTMPAMADLTSGWRRLPAMGNAGHNTSWSVSGLSGGTSYYWSVQAVDAAFAGGGWAVEGSFVGPSAPSVTTDVPSNITATAAACGGAVTDQGDSPVTARGCVWSTNAAPTVTRHDGITTNGAGLGSFDCQLTGLIPATLTYHVRAYAVNGQGAGYGEDRIFSTLTTPPGNALDFDGTNDYVAIPDADGLDLTNNYTLECWFKADSFNSLRGLISKYQTAGAGGSFLRLNTNNLVFDQMTTSNLNLQAGCWYHAAAVNSNGTHTLYLNGIEQPLYGTPMSVSNNSNALRLGSDFSGRYFDGRMDEVRIWSAVRTPEEIHDAMHRELTGDETSLEAYYSFNHLAGTALDDVTGHGHEGTLINSPVWTNSTFPCANIITNRMNLCAVWSSASNSLASSRLRLSGSTATGDAHVVFGHDEGTNDWVLSDLPPGMKRRLGRVWRTEVSGTSTVSVVLDVSGMEIPDVSQLRLLANTNGVFAEGAELSAGTLDGMTFTVSDQVMASEKYCTLGEYYGVWYVDAARPNDDGDGMSWATAKRTIQAAVDLAASYDTIWVTNGVYDEGGAVPDGYSLTGRVVVAKPLYLRSMNGASNTFIVGASDNGTNGPSAIRCVWMAGGVLEGFTLTNGFTMSSTGDWNNDRGGGGLCLDGDAVASNCVITGCSAAHGGGVNFLGGGQLDRCIVEGCHSTGQAGGLYLANGGTALCCVVRGNWAYNNNGGGAYLYFNGLLRNCLFTENISSNNGGGVLMDCGGLVQNCTFADNVCYGQGGGVSVYLTGTVENSILYGNLKDAEESNYNTGSVPANVFIYSLAQPLPAGEGNIATNPLWVAAGDYHLQADSACRNAGTNQNWMTNAVDLDGASRIFGGCVDMGCYEYTNEPTLVVLYEFHLSEENGQIWVCWETASEKATAFFDLYRWSDGQWVKVNEFPILSQGVDGGMGASYCVPDPAADATNTFRYKLVETETDGTTEEYGPFDVAVWTLRMENLSVTTNGVIIRWLSREQDTYEIQRVLRLGEVFVPLATKLPPTPPVNTYTDEVQQSGAAYYRVRVE